MTVKFEKFDLYDEGELASLKATAGKSIALRFLPSPDGSGEMVVILDAAFGVVNQNAEGVIGIVREHAAKTPKILPSVDASVNYLSYLTDQFPDVLVAR